MKSSEATSNNGPPLVSTASPRLPKLLISVRDASEVVAALDGGADWIDLKEPNCGPLGAVDVDVASGAVQAVAGRCQISAALGELIDWPRAASRRLLGVPEISVVKLGLAGCREESDWLAHWRQAAETVGRSGKKLAAVLYADAQRAEAPAAEIIVERAAEFGCRFLLIDTFDKLAGSIFAQLEADALGRILQLAQRVGLQTAVAGGMSLAEIGRLPIGGVDLIAVRGGVCRGHRTGTIDTELVRRFRRAIASRWAPETDTEPARLPTRTESA